MATRRSLFLLLLLVLLGALLSACVRRGGGGGGRGGADDDEPVQSDDDDDGEDWPMSGSVEVLLDFDQMGKFVTCVGTAELYEIGNSRFGSFSCANPDWEADCSGTLDMPEGEWDDVGSIECGWLLGTTTLGLNESSVGGGEFDAVLEGSGNSSEFGPVDATVELDLSTNTGA